MMEECKELLLVKDGKHESWEVWALTVVAQYNQCAAEKHYLINAIKNREELFK